MDRLISRIPRLINPRRTYLLVNFPPLVTLHHFINKRIRLEGEDIGDVDGR